MKKYEVTVSYRPHIRSLERVEVVIQVNSENQEAAKFEAGYQLGAKGASVLQGSVQVSVRRIR